jgi:hypothetical protein
VERVGAENLDGLKRQGLATRYDLHSDKGRAVAFCQLVRALNEKRHDRALLWLAGLAHSTADMAACNHDPVVHIATYGWGCKEWGMKLPGGKPLAEIIGCLDLGWVKDEAFNRHVDVRRFLEKGADVSALIVPAQRCVSYRRLKVEALDKRLADYLDAGGKVVWVGGGKPPGALCKGMPKDFLVKGGDRSWPVPLEKLRAGGLFAVGGTERTLARAPEGQAGWHWPSNPYAVAAECAGGERTLLAWRGAGEERIVGAAWPKGRPSVSYLPSYAVVPYFWTRETPALAPLRLELDQAGTELVKAALESVE